MSTNDLNVGAPAMARPKYLSASSLFHRALLGLVLLTSFVVISVLLFDASIASDSQPAVAEKVAKH